MADLLLDVKILTPKEVLFQGKAYSVSSKNSQGPFDVLPEHANFISIVTLEPVVVINENKQKLTFKFNQAIVYHDKNQVSVYGNPVS